MGVKQPLLRCYCRCLAPAFGQAFSYYLKPRHALLAAYRSPGDTSTDEHQAIQQTRAVEEMHLAYCLGDLPPASAAPPLAAAKLPTACQPKSQQGDVKVYAVSCSCLACPSVSFTGRHPLRTLLRNLPVAHTAVIMV